MAHPGRQAVNRLAELPGEFAALEGLVEHVQRQTANEYSSTCPQCGGGVHQNGELPDRFRMFTDGKTRAWCRRCDYHWYPDMAGDWQPPDPETLRLRAEQAERDLERSIAQAQSTLDELRRARRWIEYHQGMSENGRMLWRLRGLQDFWVDWWKLGYTPNYELWRKNGETWENWWQSPTLTIPVWGNGWQVNNIKHRLLNTPPGGGKYQQEKRGVPPAAFFCDPDRADGPLMICEGEIKSMVTFALIDSSTIQVTGLPTATPAPEMLAQFSGYDPVYVCLDPDAFIKPDRDRPAPIERMVGIIGSRARVIELPDKIDDLINGDHLDKAALRRAFARARRL